jgi:hypothetical protein
MQKDIASSLLKMEKDKAQARGILNRPISAVPSFLVSMAVVGLILYLQTIERFEAPMWVIILLVAGACGSVLNMMDLWTTRRRLDAALTLLELQSRSNE